MTEKKGKKKGKKKTDELKLIRASVDTLTAEVIKLGEEFHAFKLESKRRGPPSPRGGEGDTGPDGPMEPQGPGGHRSQEAEKEKAVRKKTAAKKKITKKKVVTSKGPRKKTAKSRATT